MVFLQLVLYRCVMVTSAPTSNYIPLPQLGLGLWLWLDEAVNFIVDGSDTTQAHNSVTHTHTKRISCQSGDETMTPHSK